MSRWILNIAGVLGVALLLLAALGEVFGWWRDMGIVMGLVGVVLTVWYGVGAASERTVRALEEPLATMADKIGTINAVLVRIETLLDARLPRP